MNVFNGPREATIQFSDVFSNLPLNSSVGDAVADFDAVLTAQVRNTGHWQDSHFPTGAWPALGDYGAVLLDQLRTQQIEEAQALGIKAGTPIADGTHPDIAALAESLEKTLVGVVNCAPRRSDHHEQGVNGDEFHVGVTKSGVEIYAQLPFFRGLHARNRLVSLHRIPNDAGVWPAGEQFRSSVVSQARRHTNVLEEVSLDLIPKLTLAGRIAYADKFGNVRLEMADGADSAQKLQIGSMVSLQIGDGVHITDVHVVSRLTDIPEGKLGIYHNPADPLTDAAPHYVELVRRVSDPNTHREHAYATLVNSLDPSGSFAPTKWDETEISIVV